MKGKVSQMKNSISELRIIRKLLIIAGLVAVGLFGWTACFGPPELPPLIPGVYVGGELPPPFSAFLSTDRSVLIRGDAEAGGATLTVTTNNEATYEWSVRSVGAGDIIDLENDVVVEGASLDAPLTVATPSTESTLRIIGISEDPGPTETQVEVKVTATERIRCEQCADAEGNPVVDENGDPVFCDDDGEQLPPVLDEEGQPLLDKGGQPVAPLECAGEQIERKLTLVVRRPEAPLTVALAPVGTSTVIPTGLIRLRATITGGEPYPADDPGECGQDCTGPIPNGRGYCVCWSAEEAFTQKTVSSIDCPREVSGVLGCLEPDSLPDPDETDETTEVDATYRAPLATGNVVFTVTVRDAAGNQVSSPLPVVVRSAETLAFAELSSESAQVAPGDSITLTAVGTGGQEPYEVRFKIVGDGIGNLSKTVCAEVDAGDPCEIDYVAPVDEVGPVLIKVTIDDGVNMPVNETISLTVASRRQLNVIVVGGSSALQPGGQTPITAKISGGTPPYAVCFGFQGAANGDIVGSFPCDPDDGFFDGFTRCVCDVGDIDEDGLTAEEVQRTYRAGGAGAVVIEVRVKDAVGAEATAAVGLDISGSAGAACGNGNVETQAGEECDDGNTSNTDGCLNSCRNAWCGDGFVWTGDEACDDGAMSATCDADCTLSLCGDGFLNSLAGEQCDDGNNVDGDGCQGNCKNPICGDGIVDPGESCDDGDTIDNGEGTCIADCSAVQTCGDGVPNGTESCDDGYTDACGNCNADCTGAGTGSTCSDGVVCPETEACDDGYTDACGSCNIDCSGTGIGSTCGDGVVCPETEVCDDGGTDDCGPCKATCLGPGTGSVCGDGILCPDTEACDDGFTDACGSCNIDCSGTGIGSTCGDGVFCPEMEACDDGGTDPCGPCNATCTGPGTGSVCGDGILCPDTEVCDDGFTDACGTCNINCTGPGIGSTCGDGVICPETEACDDGYTDACGTCNVNCTGPGIGSTCGDGVVCPETEVCDDGGTDPCGPCNAACTGPGTDSTCGDGVLCPDTEVCDDGFTDACGSCNINCTGPGIGSTCGDGVICPETEACDDDGTDDADGCSSTCAVESGWECIGEPSVCAETCGDGLVVGNEECDDGNSSNTDGCLNSCRNAWCGDGFVWTVVEACDDGAMSATCDADCTLSMCGDGFLNSLAGEQCDDGNNVDGDGCQGNCKNPICGDDIVDPGESCDDGSNNDSGEGFCTAHCSVVQTCGDDDINGTESCDDGYTDACGTCNATCTGPGTGSTCGDDIVCPETEECDDGYTDACGSCNVNCTGPGIGSTCGDGVVCPETEACDDGYTDACGTCNINCTGPGIGSTCGDGLICPETEGCDDDGTDDADGCSSTCAVEFGWDCIGEPSVCTVTCGDGLVVGNEDCDPPNGDCCSATCQFELDTTECRPAVGECDVAENCTGGSADCPFDGSAGQGDPCTTCPNTPDCMCDGAGACVNLP